MNSYFVTINNKEYAIRFEQDGIITSNGQRVVADVQQLDDQTFSVVLDGVSKKIVAARCEAGYHLLIEGKQVDARIESERTRLLKRFAIQGSGGTKRTEIRAPMPALVVRVEVLVGDEVKPGQGLVVLEAMKMENEIKAHSAGKVKEIYVGKGKAVEKGEILILVE